MMEQFEKFNEALDRLEAILTEMKNDNEALRRENAELKGVIEDRDLEILQLQEDAEKAAAAAKAEKDENEKACGEFDAVQGAQNGAGERHVQNERAHGLGALGREDFKAPQRLPEDDEENEARDFYERIHEAWL